MKKTYILALLALATMVFAMSGCKQQKKDNRADIELRDTAQQTVADTTQYGTCGDGTSMHSLELVCDDGSVNHYLIDVDDSTLSVVKGGLLAGDRMAVVSHVEYGDTIADEIINLTSLMGTWQSLDKNFEIKDGGVVASDARAESNPWTTWKILNGHLLLNADTFDIDELGADSLYLENHDGIFGFKRMKK